MIEEELEEAISRAITKNRRSLGQNAFMWSMLGDISDQVEWHGEHLTKKDWKWVFTAAVRKQRLVQGIDGGVVYLGEPTSVMSKQEMADLLDMISAFGIEHGVEWSVSEW